MPINPITNAMEEASPEDDPFAKWDQEKALTNEADPGALQRWRKIFEMEQQRSQRERLKEEAARNQYMAGVPSPWYRPIVETAPHYYSNTGSMPVYDEESSIKPFLLRLCKEYSTLGLILPDDIAAWYKDNTPEEEE